MSKRGIDREESDTWREQGSSTIVIRGLREILELSTLLEQSAASLGQPGTMHWLNCFFDNTKVSSWRQPCLVIALSAATDLNPSRLSPNQVQGAVFFTEYSLLGLRSGIFISPDNLGMRNVLARDGSHTEIVLIAMRTLLRQGARFLIASYESGRLHQNEIYPGIDIDGALWTQRNRSHPKFLPLMHTLEETLATLGKLTRRNMRYYRHRLEERVGCEYTSSVRATVPDGEIASINHDALNPIDLDEFRLRWQQATTHPDGFLAVLKTAQGEWLSFIGGWRNGTTTFIRWQVNKASYAADSLNQVMRSYFIESEIAMGARRLVFDGGTRGSIVNAFTEVPVVDLIVRRKTFLDLRFRTACLLLSASQKLLKRPYMVVEILQDRQLEWHSGNELPGILANS